MLTFLLAITDENDRSKVEKIYIKYYKMMCVVALNKLSGRPNAAYEAEEAVQNAFIKIIDYLHAIRLDESEERLNAYFAAIAVNEAINILNRRADLVSIDDLTDELHSDEDFLESLCLQSEYEQVKRAIMGLEDQYRIVLLMKYAEGMSVRNISKVLSMSEATVYTNIRRGKLLLLHLLKKDGII